MLTYTDIKNQFLRNIGQDSSTDTAILADFNNNLGTRYQMVLAKMKDYMTQNTVSTTTVAAQQYYHYPSGLTNIESVVVTIGSVKYPTTVVNSQWQWDWLNSLQVQPTAIPQFVFPRKVDFGLYPIPQDAYTMTFNYHYRDRNLGVDDYTTGSVTATNGSQTITGLGVTYTAAMVGRYFEVTDTTSDGQGYFYKITAVPTSLTLTLENAFSGTTGATLAYRIGQVPEFPDEGHICLVDGVTSDFYSGVRHDLETATWFNNKFWTGDGQNPSRKIGDSTVCGGLIGLCNQYTDRNNEHVIERNKKVYPFFDKNWAGTIT
jgi:hypothetical protein